MKQLFGFVGDTYCAFSSYHIPPRLLDYDKINRSVGIVTNYDGANKIGSVEILLSDEVFESPFNDERYNSLKEFLIDKKITEMDTVNPSLELGVEYALYDSDGRMITSGDMRVDGDVFNAKIVRNTPSDDNELTYTIGKMIQGHINIPIIQRGSYGIKKIKSPYPFEFRIIKIKVLGNTYDHFIDSEVNKCKALKRRPAIRHSDLITDPRYYYDRYPHQCEPLPTMCGEEAPPAWMPPPMFPEMGRTNYIQDYDPRMDYIPGPDPMVGQYMPEPDPNHPMHPKNVPAPKPYCKPELRFDERFDPHPTCSRYKKPRRIHDMEKYRRPGEFDAERITIFEQKGSDLKYNGVFKFPIDSVDIDLTIVLDNFVEVYDDREILQILKDNSPSSGVDKPEKPDRPVPPPPRPCPPYPYHPCCPPPLDDTIIKVKDNRLVIFDGPQPPFKNTDNYEDNEESNEEVTEDSTTNEKSTEVDEINDDYKDETPSE